MKHDEVDATGLSIDGVPIGTTGITAEWNVILTSESTATEQTPTGLDAPLQIEMGPNQGTPNVDKVAIDSSGTLTFRDGKQYRIVIESHAGRTGAAGTSLLVAYFKINDVITGKSVQYELDNANTNAYRSNVLIPTLEDGDELKFFIVRDPAFNNSGGLLVEDVTATGIPEAVTAAITVSELVITGDAISTGDDVNAIHVNEDNEITGITEKVTPVASDLLVIEDSASGFIKKRIQLGNIPSIPSSTGTTGMGNYVWNNTNEGGAPANFSIVSKVGFISSETMGFPVESDSTIKSIAIALQGSSTAAAGAFEVTIQRFEKDAPTAYTSGAGVTLATVSIPAGGALPPLFYRSLVDDTLDVTVGGTNPVLFAYISLIGFWSISIGFDVYITVEI